MSLRLRSPLVHSTALVLAIALGCEVRLETPPDDDFNADFDDEFSSNGDYRPGDAPPLTPTDPDGDLGSDYPSNDPLENEPPYADLSPHLYPALIVVGADVIEGPRASNAASDAAFSFRAQMEWLAGERDPVDFTRAWLEQWETVTAVGAAQAPVVPRPAVRSRLIAPWLGASAAEPPARGASDPAYDAGVPSGANDTGYGANAQGTPEAPASWSSAPFRLIAIVNRVDLASEPCATGGELRYVYTAVHPDGGGALEMTAILEIPYPSTRPAAEWARAWRDLAALPPGEAYAAELERLAREVRADADPLRVRLLTSEVELASAESPGWEMREFHLEIDGGRLALLQAPLAQTPRADIEPAHLSEHVLTHADAIRGAGVALPDELQAGAAPLATPDFRWRVLGVSESLSHAFSVRTCNGCHGGDTRALPFQHIMPIEAPGIAARVSRFLYDPEAPSDELRRRGEALDALAQTACEPPAGTPVYP